MNVLSTVIYPQFHCVREAGTSLIYSHPRTKLWALPLNGFTDFENISIVYTITAGGRLPSIKFQLPSSYGLTLKVF